MRTCLLLLNKARKCCRLARAALADFLPATCAGLLGRYDRPQRSRAPVHPFGCLEASRSANRRSAPYLPIEICLSKTAPPSNFRASGRTAPRALRRERLRRESETRRALPTLSSRGSAASRSPSPLAARSSRSRRSARPNAAAACTEVEPRSQSLSKQISTMSRA